MKAMPTPVLILLGVLLFCAVKPDAVRSVFGKAAAWFHRTPDGPAPAPVPTPDAKLFAPAEALRAALAGKQAKPIRDFYREFAETIDAAPEGKIATSGIFREIHQHATKVYARLVPAVVGLGVEKQISDVFIAALGTEDVPFDRAAAIRACKAVEWASQ